MILMKMILFVAVGRGGARCCKDLGVFFFIWLTCLLARAQPIVISHIVYIYLYYFPTPKKTLIFALHRKCRCHNVRLGPECIACICANVPFDG